MSDTKLRQSLNNLEAALQRLKEALQEPEENSLVIDGTIQRFEFVIELYWKTLKRMLAFATEEEAIRTLGDHIPFRRGSNRVIDTSRVHGSILVCWIDND